MLATYRLISDCNVSTRESDGDPLVKRAYSRSGIMLFMAAMSLGRFARRCNEFILTDAQLLEARDMLRITRVQLREHSEANRLAAKEEDLLPAGESAFDSDESGNDLMQSGDLGMGTQEERLGLPLLLYQILYPTVVPCTPPPPRTVGMTWTSDVPLQYGSAKFRVPYMARLIAKLPDNPLLEITFSATPVTFPGEEVSLSLTVAGTFRLLASAEDIAALAIRGDLRILCDAKITKFDQTTECRILDYKTNFSYHRIPATFDDDFAYLRGCDPNFTNPYAKLLDFTPPEPAPATPAP